MRRSGISSNRFIGLLQYKFRPIDECASERILKIKFSVHIDRSRDGSVFSGGVATRYSLYFRFADDVIFSRNRREDNVTAETVAYRFESQSRFDQRQTTHRGFHTGSKSACYDCPVEDGG